MLERVAGGSTRRSSQPGSPSHARANHQSGRGSQLKILVRNHTKFVALEECHPPVSGIAVAIPTTPVSACVKSCCCCFSGRSLRRKPAAAARGRMLPPVALAWRELACAHAIERPYARAGSKRKARILILNLVVGRTMIPMMLKSTGPPPPPHRHAQESPSPAILQGTGSLSQATGTGL